MSKNLIENIVLLLKTKNNLTVNEMVELLFKEKIELKKIYEEQVIGREVRPDRQCQAEIGSLYLNSKTFKEIVKRIKNEKNKWVYFIENDNLNEDAKNDLFIEKIKEEDELYAEKELYPLFMRYLKSVNIYSKRIEEKRSKNNKGSGGNKWLHPDIVGIRIKDEGFDIDVRNCLDNFNYNKVEMLSYEIKKVIKRSDVREYFFQSVSNSSWSNNGYLVATEIAGDLTFEELSILSSLHGIGFILLNIKEPEKSEIKLPAAYKQNVDWRTINRIVKENPDFKDYIVNIKEYFQTNRIRDIDWKIED